MRFCQLALEAYGPFTNEVLDLSGGAPGGLHVIYGPNEAGKSTSLRAVEGLLFGIPERCGDAHVHPLKSLAVGALLERGTGTDRQELWVTRRKRRKDSLVDEHGQPLPEDVLGPWLSGLDQRTFFARFGLDQERLEQGAEALLGGSEEGLFAAGTAGPDVARLLQDLAGEEEALYGPRAKRPLNRALTAFTEASRSARQAARPPEKWREQQRAYERALARVEELRQGRARLKLEQGRLNRLAAVRSDVARWAMATEELERLGPQPELPLDAEERRVDAERAHRDAQREAERLSEETRELRERLGKLPPRRSLLEVDEAHWDALGKKIGSEHKAREDRPGLEGKLAAGLEELERYLVRIGKASSGSPLTVVDALRVPSSVERRAQRLSARHAHLELGVTETQRQLEESLGELALLESASEVRDILPLDVEALELALGQARQALTRAQQREELNRERQRLAGRVARIRQEVGTQFPAVDLARELPQEAEVTRAQAEVDALRRALWRAEEARSEQQLCLEEAIVAMNAQQLAGDVPSEARLAEQRRERDAHLRSFDAVKANVSALQEWFSELGSRIADADHTADRLRLEAHRISEREKQLTARERAQHALERLEGECRDAQHRLEALEAVWAVRRDALGLKSIDLADLVNLRRALAELIELEEKLALREQALASLAEEVGSAQGALSRAMGASASAAAELPALVELGAERLAEGRGQREKARMRAARAEQLALQIEQRKRRAEEAERLLAEWQAQWRDVLRELGLSLETPADEVQAVLAERAEIERIAEDARDKHRRLEGIFRDSQELAEQVRTLVEQHAPDILGQDALIAAQALVSRVRAARDVQRERERLEGELSAKSQRLAEAERASREAFSVLEELMRAAKVTKPAELAEVEQRSRRLRQLRAERAALEESLRAKAAPGSFQDLVTEARSMGELELAAQRDDIEARLDETEEELRSAEHDAAALERGLELYQSEDAALAQQRAAHATEEARRLLREFLVLRTARVLLKREVTRYAEKHQGPILARAGELFPRLTLGKYSGLRVGMAERTLRCVQQGRELDVGELSRGTRAQLYLALRLASLEHHFEHREPVPLIFDDLLVDFDDDRACAAFEVLGELAERVQILYFTHLGRDLHAARDAVPQELLFEHRIGVLSSVAEPA